MRVTPKTFTPATASSAPKSQNLGQLDNPGKTLGKTTQTVAPGGSLVFRATTNQITGLGTLTVTPKGAATISQKLIKPMQPGVLGSKDLYQYTITMNKNAKPGTSVQVRAPGTYQARNDPNWAFAFSLKAS
jgi:hypothetical protein